MLARRPRRGRGSRSARTAWCWDRPPVLGSCWDDPLQNRVSAGGSSALWIPVQRVVVCVLHVIYMVKRAGRKRSDAIEPDLFDVTVLDGCWMS